MEMDQVESSPGFLYLGERQDQRMEFPIEIYCERPMDILKQTRVKDWLFGGKGWKRLQICAKHQNTFYYNCRLIPGDDVNLYAYDGFRCMVQCDSPYAYEFLRTMQIRYSGGSHKFLFNNRSQDIDYMWPEVEFKLAGSATAFSLKNIDDDDRVFAFSGLEKNEVITVDCSNNFISSSTGKIRLDNFNGNFFRFDKGVNRLEASGQVAYLIFRYQNLKRLGGGFV